MQQEKIISDPKLAKGRFGSRLPKLSKKFWLIVGIIFALLLGATVGFLVFNKEPEPPQPTADTAKLESQNKSLVDDYTNRQKASEQTTPQQQRIDTQANVANLKDPNNAQESLQVYIDAAFAAARVKDPQAKVYAQKALDLYPQDTETRQMNTGQISRLEAIAKGEYELATQ